ncbi:hypothetical protein RD792_004473 [Penstemon davidsonii]|uniref:Uncharacterized protein n=1 Tax=Penstemon davidsonii TaxID=160366 RepID=A0ABR0DIN5_9LAMI|nr:hypothetical protein RD792_004473 [Penstemon davidsonii]
MLEFLELKHPCPRSVFTFPGFMWKEGKALWSSPVGPYGSQSTITTNSSVEQALNSSSTSTTVLEFEVKIVGVDGMIRVQSDKGNYPAARLMDAMRDDLELQIHNASCKK